MAKLVINQCVCPTCKHERRCDFYYMACKGADCQKCQGPMKHGDCKDYERKVN